MTFSMNSNVSLSHKSSLTFNTLGLLGICVSLLMAFYWQIAFNELPCPLCQLQRLGFILVGMGFMLNMQYGASSVHYAMIILACIAGASASLRQVLLHIAPGDAGYGSPLFGIHFYTWGFISFVAAIAYTAFLLILDRRQLDGPRTQPLSRGLLAIIVLFAGISLANVISSVMVCQFGPCPDDPTRYLWSF